MQSYVVSCSGCGKRLLTYSKTSRIRYKSPISSCKHCGAVYADPRCRELAVEGLLPDTFSINPRLIQIVLGGLITYRGYYLLGMRQLDSPECTQWLMPTVFIIMGVILLIGAIIDIIAIKSGLKAKKYDRLMQESEIRLRDSEYARLMQQLGYDVPEKYLY